MANPSFRQLNERERDINARLAASPQSESVQLEKTIVVAAFAIVEAIWKARE